MIPFTNSTDCTWPSPAQREVRPCHWLLQIVAKFGESWADISATTCEVEWRRVARKTCSIYVGLAIWKRILGEKKSETMKTPLEHGRLLKALSSPKLTAVIPERRVFIERVLT